MTFKGDYLSIKDDDARRLNIWKTLFYCDFLRKKLKKKRRD